MFLEHVVTEDRELVDQEFRQAVEAGRDWDFECRIVRYDKVVRWIRACGRPIRDEGGSPRRLVGIVQDITERKQAEEQRYQFVSLAENSHEFIGMCDTQFKPFFVNEAGMRTVGLGDLEQALQTPVKEFSSPKIKPSSWMSSFRRCCGTAMVKWKFASGTSRRANRSG